MMMMLMMLVICAKRGESKGEPAGPDGRTKGCGLRAAGCGRCTRLRGGMR